MKKKDNYHFPPEYPYGDNDIPEIDLPPATDDIPIVPDELQRADDTPIVPDELQRADDSERTK